MSTTFHRLTDAHFRASHQTLSGSGLPSAASSSYRASHGGVLSKYMKINIVIIKTYTEFSLAFTTPNDFFSIMYIKRYFAQKLAKLSALMNFIYINIQYV